MMKVVELTSAQLPALNSLVSKAFGYQSPHCFLDDFPVWGSSLPGVVRLGIFDQQKLVSHVGIRFCEMQTPSGLKPIALIGAVATDETYRGKGLSTSLLNEALRLIDETSCEWTLLWGSEHEFYGKLGFKLAGNQARVEVAKLDIKAGVKLDTQVYGGMNETIFQALLQETTGVKLTEKDRSWIEAHKTIQWYWTKTPFAFVGYQRGLDLHHIVHEFGGYTVGIQRLLYELYSKDSKVQVMGKAESVQDLGFDPDDLTREYLCLARPKNKNTKWDPSFWVAGISAC